MTLYLAIIAKFSPASIYSGLLKNPKLFLSAIWNAELVSPKFPLTSPYEANRMILLVTNPPPSYNKVVKSETSVAEL